MLTMCQPDRIFAHAEAHVASLNEYTIKSLILLYICKLVSQLSIKLKTGSR